jgi:Fe-S-cluster containining protein
VVFELLETVAAQGELIHQDDTSVRMVTLMKDNQRMRAHAAAQGFSRPKERTGMCTTALVLRVGERWICLYSSGRAHAGEHVAALLEQREADQAPPRVMSDALSRHAIDEEPVVRCPCLAHGRRQCSDIEEVCPSACRLVLAVIKQVCDHDEEAREKQRSPEARLASHQAQSQPLMDPLKAWLDTQMADRLGEPPRSLGQAIASRHTHWGTLTRLLQIAGAPRDHTLVERAVKLCIRQRTTSLFSTSEPSASLARVLTRLIATCIDAGVNGLEYLVALQAHRAEVCAAPAAGLPWTSQASLAPPEATRRQS